MNFTSMGGVTFSFALVFYYEGNYPLNFVVKKPTSQVLEGTRQLIKEVFASNMWI